MLSLSLRKTHTSSNSAGVPVLYAFINRSLGLFGCFESRQTLSDRLLSGLSSAREFWSGVWPVRMGFGLHLSRLVGWNGFDCHLETVKKPLLMQEIHAARSGSITMVLQDFQVSSFLVLSMEFIQTLFNRLDVVVINVVDSVMKLSRCFQSSILKCSQRGKRKIQWPRGAERL